MERRLVERAMHGDEAAFDALIGHVGDHLHSVARRILRDPLPGRGRDATGSARCMALPSSVSATRIGSTPRRTRLVVNACHAEARRERHHHGNLRLLDVDARCVRPGDKRVAGAPAGPRLCGARCRAPHGRCARALRRTFTGGSGCCHGDAHRHGTLAPSLRLATTPRGLRG